MTTKQMRAPLVSGNWKMNLNHFEAIQLIQKLAFGIRPEVHEKVEVAVHPPFTDIRTVQTLLDSDRIPMMLGAQHCHWESSGAFTGEVSATMLAKLNVRYVLAGHSERRQLFGETDEMVNKRVKAVRAENMVPIICVGETLDEREAGDTYEKVQGQVVGALEGLDAGAVAGLVIAYEPIWAIGTGRNATSEDAQTTCADIRKCIAKQWGQAAGAAVRIQYGGSVKAANAGELITGPDVDGFLVGGASLDADEFALIATAVADSAA